jgi:hypothetical protein
MVKLPIDPLSRLRPLPQALADLVAKHDGLHFKHPERRDLARMIAQLKAEITWRTAQATAG